MKTQLIKNGYIIDQEKNIWSRPGYVGINYNDGDEFELRIWKIIKQATDITVLSTELRQHCTDWPSLGNLSGTRANILRPFSKFLTGDILEIGAGYGAITRYLGECGGNVLALEGSPRRAEIARSRTRDLENVTVLAEKLDQFQWDSQFDVIILIGVLEHINRFITGENPAVEMLQQVRSLLKPDGKMILAIENQLGLKYFAGAPEDHMGKPMYGIEGRYRSDEPQTFGHSVLAGMLEEAGYASYEFLIPLPDYKLPVSILTEEGIKSRDFDASVFAWQSACHDPQLPPLCNFSLELAWRVVFDNQIALELANSFLIVASSRTQQLVESGVLAYHYSTDRKPAFCKETVFRRTGSGEIVVQYHRLAEIDQEQCSNPIINFIYSDSDRYILGKPLLWEFIQIVTKDGWSIDGVAQIIKRYLTILEKIAHEQGIETDFSSPHSLLPGAFFDVLPQNIIIHKNDRNATLIDRECELSRPIEIGYLLFRTLLGLFSMTTRFGHSDVGNTMTRSQFVDAVLAAAGMRISADKLEAYTRLDSEIQEQVKGRPAKEFSNWCPTLQLSVLNLSQAIAMRDEQIATLQTQLLQSSNTMQKIKRALTVFEQVIDGLKKESISSKLSSEVGELCFSLGLFNNARYFFENTLSLDPKCSDALNNLGVLNYQLGDYNTARSYFIKTLTINPDHREAKTNLAALSNNKSSFL